MIFFFLTNLASSTKWIAGGFILQSYVSGEGSHAVVSYKIEELLNWRAFRNPFLDKNIFFFHLKSKNYVWIELAEVLWSLIFS